MIFKVISWPAGWSILLLTWTWVFCWISSLIVMLSECGSFGIINRIYTDWSGNIGIYTSPRPGWYPGLRASSDITLTYWLHYLWCVQNYITSKNGFWNKINNKNYTLLADHYVKNNIRLTQLCFYYQYCGILALSTFFYFWIKVIITPQVQYIYCTGHVLAIPTTCIYKVNLFKIIYSSNCQKQNIIKP